MKKLLFFIYLTFYLAIQLPFANGQPSSLSFQHLTTADRLSSDNITCILQDSRGFIWIGTDGGLNRYDGKEVKQYFANPFDTLSLNVTEIHQLFEDTEGYIWVFQNGPIQRLDPKTECFEGIHESMHNEAFIRRKDIENAMDTTFIILQFKTRDGQNPIIDLFDAGMGHTFLEKSDNTVWISSPNGLLVFDPATQQTRPFPTPGSGLNEFDFKNVQLLYEDESNRIWINTSGGIRSIDTEKGEMAEVINYSSGPRTGRDRYRAFSNRILVDGQGKIWMKGMDGIQIYDPGASQLKHHRYDESSFIGLSSNQVNCLMEDDQGRVWIGTDKGINIFDPSFPVITHYSHDPLNSRSLPSNEVRGALENDEKGLWIFHKTFISYLDYNTHSFSTNHLYRRNDENKEFWGGGFKDKEGKIYALEIRPMRILEYDPKQNKFVPHQASDLPVKLHPYTRTLPFIDSRENQFYYSYMPGMRGREFFNDTIGLVRYQPISGEMKYYHPGSDSPDGLSVNLVNHIIEYSKDSSIWLATYENGIYKLDSESHKKTQYRFNPANPKGLNHDNPSLLFEDSHGNIWVRSGYGEGVEMIPQKTIQSDSFYTVKFNMANSDLTSNHISGFHEDSFGNIWIGTPRGVFKYDFTTETIRQFKFSTDRSILSGFGSFSKGESGRFYIGTQEGLFTFHPDSIKEQSTPPRPYLADLWIDNIRVPLKGTSGDTFPWQSPLEKTLFFTDEIRLPHWQNDFTLDFSAINFSAPEQTTYEYKLENYDEEWKITGPDRSEATYTNMSPGKYVFQVKAMNGDGFWSQEAATLTITITPPWYWNIWSKAIYLFFIFLFIYWAYRYQLNRKLAIADAKRLRELDTFKTQLYTNITHEFRTPLTVISGMTDQIEAEPQKWLREGLKMIRRNTHNLLSLVNQMLDLRKLESGSMTINRVQADVIPYLKYLLESFHSYAESKDIRVHFISSLDECVMDYDPEKLQQIISNLMSNAIKFTKRGGDVYLIVDKVEGGRLSISRVYPAKAGGPGGGEGNTARLMLKIKDTGAGIPKDQLENIFDRFYQADDSTTREGEGTGIGLSLTKALVHLLGGDISVKSQVGEGSEFTVTLPITKEAPSMAKEMKKETPAMVRATLANFKDIPKHSSSNGDFPLALIVEDNADVVQYLMACLEAAYQIEVAGDGKEGIEKAFELTPDIIISDVMMPRKDGFELTEKLKTDVRTSHIPIILLTAKADVESKIKGLSRGADAYLPKPFNRQELLVRMEKLLDLRKHLRKHYLSLAGGMIPPKSGDKTLNEEVMEHQFVQKAKQVVEKNLTNYDFKVSDLHEKLNMSHSNLHRKLKALTGFSALEFIHHIRLQKAKKLLRHTEEPVSNIAYDTGYSDPGHFSRVFKKETGLSPSEFRERGLI